MGTKFEEVYCLASLIKSDKRLAKLTPPNLMFVEYGYLVYAIGFFLKDCYPEIGKTEPKVSQYIPFSQNCYEYIADGIETSFSLTNPRIANSEFFVTETINDEVTVIPKSEYRYDVLTNSIIFNTAPPNTSVINIVDYFEGEFLDTLGELEKVILANGMQIPFLEATVNSQSLLQLAIYGNLKFHSQSEMIYRVSTALQNQINYVDRLIMNYSYRYNQNNYTGLRGNI